MVYELKRVAARSGRVVTVAQLDLSVIREELILSLAATLDNLEIGQHIGTS